MAKNRRVWELALPEGVEWPDFVVPPDNGSRFLKMLKIEIGGQYECTILSPQLVSMWVHFLDERTVPCLETVGAMCEFCGPKTSRRWESFVAVRSERHKETGIIRITEGCYKGNAVLKGAKGDLTGKRLVLWRVGNHNRGRLLARLDLLTTKEIKPADRWSSAALRGQLNWIWGIKIKGGNDNG